MYVIMVQLDVTPEHRDVFVTAMSAHAERARRDEPGPIRFDVISDESDPNRIYVYEAYVDRAALDAHNQSASIAQFRDETKGLSASFARLGRGQVGCPPDGDSYWHK